MGKGLTIDVERMVTGISRLVATLVFVLKVIRESEEKHL